MNFTYVYKPYHTFPILKWAWLTNEAGKTTGMPRTEITTTVILGSDVL